MSALSSVSTVLFIAVLLSVPSLARQGAEPVVQAVTLEPGEYSLTMQFADGDHRSYGPRLASKPIVITVE